MRGMGKTRAWLGTMVVLVAAFAVMAAGSFHPAAAGGLKVAAVFETPIEEPWVNQIHVALVKAKKELGHRIRLERKR